MLESHLYLNKAILGLTTRHLTLACQPKASGQVSASEIYSLRISLNRHRAGGPVPQHLTERNCTYPSSLVTSTIHLHSTSEGTITLESCHGGRRHA